MSAIKLDMLVLANLEAHRHNLEKIRGVSKNAGQLIPTPMGNEGSMRHRVSYFRGKWVSKCTSILVHGVGQKHFKSLVAHYEEHGLVPLQTS